MAQCQIEEVDAVGGALKFAIATAASGGKQPEKLRKEHRARAVPFVRRLERVADSTFFSALEKRYLATNDDERHCSRAHFVIHLVEAARCLLREATEATMCPVIRRYRARARAHDAFEAALRRAGSGPLADLTDELHRSGAAR